MSDRKGTVPSILIWLVLACPALPLTLSADEPQSAIAESHNCRLWGIIAEQAPEATIQDHLIDLPNSLESLSPANTDGWGIGFYVGSDLTPTVLRGYPAAYVDPNFDPAVATVAAATPRLAIAHVRNASTGAVPPTGDPHPFERVKNGRHWLFEHNGTVDKSIVLSLIRPEYIAANPPLYGDITTNWNAVIDSDLYFLFLLQTLEDFNWQVKPAIGYAIESLRAAIPGSDERLNFLLTDGTTLWGYRQGGTSYTLYYLYNTVGTAYSAIASQYPTATQGDWVLMQSGQIVTLRQSAAPLLESIEDYFGETLIVDNNFDASATSADLRAAGGWYESRGEAPTLLTLNEANVGGNGSKKAALAASSTTNAYLSQAFTSIPATQTSVRWDVYVDNILDGAERDRGALQLIGQDLDGTNGPNSTSTERFVFLAFYAPGGAETGTMSLIAREPGDDYANSTAWRTVASGLELDRWYTLQVDCDLAADTYDVYVNGALRAAGVQAFTPMTQLTHISFAQWNDGSGAFFVDNVYEGQALDTRTLVIASNPVAGGTTVPATGSYNFAEGDVVAVSAIPAAGYRFDFWTGNVADPASPNTNVVMDQDQTVTARFSLLPVSFLADNDLGASIDSDALRANGSGQDWYESRADVPSLLTLSTDDIGGNTSPKAAFEASATGNAYLTQEFGQPQTGVFGATWDIYVDQILDRSGPDYSGWMMLGDDADGIRGPNSTSNDRFVYLAFEKDGGGTDGTMDLVAREPGAAWDAFTTIAAGLFMDQWYTIGVVCDVAADTYDVFVDGELVRADLPAYLAKASITHLSFAQWNDGSGIFYVDNIYEGFTLLVAVDPLTSGVTSPSAGTHLYADGSNVAIEAQASTGYEFDFWDGDVVDPNSAATSIAMDEGQVITAHFEALAIPLLADGYFDASTTSEELRANGTGQDWYESRGQYPTLLTLNNVDIGGNASNKAAFASSTSYNAYLSQEFVAAQTTTFSLSWDVYVDNIVDNSTGDRAAFQLIGQDIDGTSGPNSTSTERFVFLAFWAEGGASTGTMNLIAREPGDTYNTSSAWALVAGGLAMDAWHTIRVVGDIGTDTYDVYVDGSLARAGVLAYAPMTQVTHISFAQWNDGSGAFYVDNVMEPMAPTYNLMLAVDPAGAGTTSPSIGAHEYDENEIVTITASPSAGYQFDSWDGDVADPGSISTTVLMNADKSVTARFSPAPVTLIADSYYDIDATSAALRADGPGQDWYESRGANPELLVLSSSDIGGNATNKAQLVGSPTGNVYLSQELAVAQSDRFALQWDIYVEEILDISSPDRAGWMLIGDNSDPNRPGPNSDPAERFVQMAFFRNGGGTSGTMDLVARERGAAFTAFTTVTSGLELGQWYTIKVACDLASDTYDVYVNDVYQATLTSYALKTSLTHISFGQWNDGAGTFYVDNVLETELPPTYALTLEVDPAGSADTDPAIGSHDVPVGATVAVSATAHAGYAFDYWTGDVVDPNSASTEIVMDGDKTITAHFSEVPIVFLADGAFDEAVDSDDLRTDGAGQDWYESRGDQPALVQLNTDPISGNLGPKALFLSSTSGNVYLSQEFGAPQTGLFAAQWEIYVDEITNLASSPDRTGWMLIGDASNTNRPGPNSDPDERFVQMAFFRDGGGSSGTMDLVARERGASFENFTTVASGLSMDEWHLIKVVCDIDADTYTVYVDGVYRANVTSYAAKSVVTHMSFAQWNDGAGTFYVDNVVESTLPATYTLTLDAAPPGAGTTIPAIGGHGYLEGTLVGVEALSASGYVFTSWTGEVLEPAQAVTSVLIDGDKTVTANFIEGIGGVSGLVRSGGTGLHGVYVDLYNPAGSLFARGITDENGYYAMLNLPADRYRLVVQTPFGFSVTGGSERQVEVTNGELVRDLDLTVSLSGGVIDYWGWKREIMAISEGRVGDYRMTRAQIDGYLLAIFNAYYGRGDGHGVSVLNVTHTGDPARAMNLDDVVYQWHLLADNSQAQTGRKFLLADLLNIAAARLSQLAVVSADGATASQAVRSLAESFNAGPITSALVDAISMIHQNRTVAAGFVDLSTPNIMYGGFGQMSLPPVISCPGDPIALDVCGPGHVCVPLAIQDYGEILITPSIATWSAGQLCFDYTEVRDYAFHITATPAEAGYNPAECDVTVSLRQIPSPVITAPGETVNLFACVPGQLCIDLPVTNYVAVTVPGGAWSDNRLCFAADTAGLYTFAVTASNACASAESVVSARVTLGQPVAVTCPAEPHSVDLCTPGQVCVDLPISQQTSVTVPGADWSDGHLCFAADTAGQYLFAVTALNECDTVTCNVAAQVTFTAPVAITCPAEPTAARLCEPGLACIDLPILNQTGVVVEGAVWSDGRLCFEADTTGVYLYHVTAANACTSSECDLSVAVTITQPVAITCPAEPASFMLCEPGEVCLDLPVTNQTEIRVDGATWTDGRLCFHAAESGSFSFEVTALNECDTAVCTVAANVSITPAVAITCPTEPLPAYLCGPGQACVDLPIANHSEVTVVGGDWADGHLCFAADTAGVYSFAVSASNTCGQTDCDLTVEVLFNPAVTIDCPGEPIPVDLCSPGEVCVSLPIVHQTSVTVDGAVWADGRLCFDADTSGYYAFHVTAANACQSTTCDLAVQVAIAPAVAIICPAEPQLLAPCAPGTACLALPIVNQTDVTVAGATWSDGQLCFNADTSGVYLFTVTASNGCGEMTCAITVPVTITPPVEIVCPLEPLQMTLCWAGEICIDLPIAHQTSVSVDGGTWANGRLCFVAAASGTHNLIVTAANACGSNVCVVSFDVTITGLDLSIAPDGITLSSETAQPGDIVTVSALVRSDARSSDAADVVVRFFDGDPSYGVQIGSDQIIPTIGPGDATAVQVDYVVAELLPRDLYVVVDPDRALAECAEDNNAAHITIESTPIAATIRGTLVSSATGLFGIQVDLLDGASTIVRQTTTSEDGQYSMAEVPSGAYTVRVELPLGFAAVSPASVPIVMAGIDQVVNFELRSTAASSVIDYWTWKREIMAIHDGRVGDYRMTRAQIDGYLQAIFDAYYNRGDGLRIDILNVTHTGSPARAMTLDDVYYQWHVVVDNSQLQLARKFLLADLLNIASLRLSQLAVVTADGATTAQAIRYFADRFAAGTVDATLAANVGRIHQRLTIPAGVVPLTTPNVVYKPAELADEPAVPGDFALRQNYPNPFNPVTEISFTLPNAVEVRLEVFNALGQSVATLLDKSLDAGEHSVTWNASECASGIYLYRLTAGELEATKKMVLLK